MFFTTDTQPKPRCNPPPRISSPPLFVFSKGPLRTSAPPRPVFHDRRPLRTHNCFRAAAPLFRNGDTMSFRAFMSSRPSVSTLSRSGPIVRTFLKFSCHKGFSGDTLREVRSLAGLQPLKSQTPSFLGVSCFTCRILIIEKKDCCKTATAVKQSNNLSKFCLTPLDSLRFSRSHMYHLRLILVY